MLQSRGSIALPGGACHLVGFPLSGEITRLMDDKHLTGTLERRDSRSIRFGPDALLCIACVRNEMLRLPYFLDYHRSLGIDRFLVVDNGSDDGTLDFLLSQPDVHVFFTGESYAASHCGVTWINHLLAAFADGHWCLTLDADELFVFPSCETSSLRTLTRYLDSEGAEGLKTFLLDMYADRPIADTNYPPGAPFLDTCRYFDWNTYHEVDGDGIPLRGGPRHRLFWAGRPRANPSPVLKKIPLVKWRAGLRYKASTHLLDGAIFSRLSGLLLHFKLFSDFPESADREAGRMEHWNGAAQYKFYHDVLRHRHDLTAFGPHSVRFEDTAQLVALGLMRVPPGYAAWLSEETRRSRP